eukprot:TRINITY_DN64069_c0_g1_i1.p1 TRINITY_DN64069_c0_g1~~TRINITY_DN64069_c0_g1_i1.p1  ORF type:complete len:332 (+),score=18.43 TRINITY_DN64069_c0_g1_i1:44-1039(+)
MMWAYVPFAFILTSISLYGCGNGSGTTTTTSTTTTAKTTKNTSTTAAATTITTTLCQTPRPLTTPDLNLMQWNPHYQCFQDAHCKQIVLGTAVNSLKEDNIDFANFIEFPASWPLPPPWNQVSRQCGKDRTTLVFDSTKWSLSDTPASMATGCILDGDRPFIVQQFNGRANDKIIVIGAHYGHCSGVGDLGAAVRAVMQATHVHHVVLIADTNRHAWNVSEASDRACAGDRNGTCSPGAICQSNEEILAELNSVCTSRVVGTQPMKTCCSNPKIPDSQAFLFPFDRIIANFGASMSTKVVDLSPLKSESFHRGVIGRLASHQIHESNDVLA